MLSILNRFFSRPEKKEYRITDDAQIAPAVLEAIASRAASHVILPPPQVSPPLLLSDPAFEDIAERLLSTIETRLGTVIDSHEDALEQVAKRAAGMVRVPKPDFSSLPEPVLDSIAQRASARVALSTKTLSPELIQLIAERVVTGPSAAVFREAALDAVKRTAQETAAGAGSEMLPRLVREAVEPLVSSVVQSVVSKIVETVAWEVVPDLSELLIKQRMEAIDYAAPQQGSPVEVSEEHAALDLKGDLPTHSAVTRQPDVNVPVVNPIADESPLDVPQGSMDLSSDLVHDPVVADALGTGSEAVSFSESAESKQVITAFDSAPQSPGSSPLSSTEPSTASLPSTERVTGPLRPRFARRDMAPLPVEVASEEQSFLHRDARRFARMLVEELKMYYMAKIERGRTASDIYGSLKAEIDLSRQSYDKRVPVDVKRAFDYLHQELVDSLAGGDLALMGPSYPGLTRGVVLSV